MPTVRPAVNWFEFGYCPVNSTPTTLSTLPAKGEVGKVIKRNALLHHLQRRHSKIRRERKREGERAGRWSSQVAWPGRVGCAGMSKDGNTVKCAILWQHWDELKWKQSASTPRRARHANNYALWPWQKMTASSLVQVRLCRRRRCRCVHATSAFACGSCTYSCSAHIPLQS